MNAILLQRIIILEGIGHPVGDSSQGGAAFEDSVLHPSDLLQGRLLRGIGRKRLKAAGGSVHRNYQWDATRNPTHAQRMGLGMAMDDIGLKAFEIF